MATQTSAARILPSRRFALRLLYVYTLAGAGGLGVWLLLSPASFAAAFGLPAPDVFMIGIVGAVYAAFALIAAIGLRDPEPFAPVFLLQLVYKTLWLVVVFVPRAVRGGAPLYAWTLAAVFVTYVVLDLIALTSRASRASLSSS